MPLAAARLFNVEKSFEAATQCPAHELGRHATMIQLVAQPEAFLQRACDCERHHLLIFMGTRLL